MVSQNVSDDIGSIANKNSAAKLAGLETYTGSWTKTQASHLIRRTHLGMKVNDLNYARSFSNATDAVNAIVDNAVSTPLPDDPQWYSNGNSGDVNDVYDIQFRWMDGMFNSGLLERMVLFWSNHFAVSYSNMNELTVKASGSYASHMYKYWKLLFGSGFGNFKDLVSAVSKNSAMLYYLNTIIM